MPKYALPFLNALLSRFVQYGYATSFEINCDFIWRGEPIVEMRVDFSDMPFREFRLGKALRELLQLL